MDCTGWFSSKEAETLSWLAGRVAREGMVAVEVGSWKGLSTISIAAAVIKVGGRLYCVDHWLGTEGSPERETAQKQDIFAIFRDNMKALDLWCIICPMVMASADAQRVFADGTADLVFLDGDHRYPEVLKDIRGWLPKVKAGGILCGHDCEGRLSDSRIRAMVEGADENIDMVVNHELNMGCHPGVIRAVTEVFSDGFMRKDQADDTIWWVEC